MSTKENRLATLQWRECPLIRMHKDQSTGKKASALLDGTRAPIQRQTYDTTKSFPAFCNKPKSNIERFVSSRSSQLVSTRHHQYIMLSV